MKGDRWKGGLKPGSKPYGESYAAGKADDVDEDFKQSEDDEGANAHGVRFVEGGPTTLLTRFAEELRRAPAAGGF